MKLNNEEKSTELIIENAEKLLFDLAERGRFRNHQKFNLALDQSIFEQRNVKVLLVCRPRTDLDEKLVALHKSDLVIIAGRPNGKTALQQILLIMQQKNQGYLQLLF